MIFRFFVHLYDLIKKDGLTELDITFISESDSRLKDSEARYRLLNDHIEDLKS
jgi:hypothetical protein